MDNFCQEVKSGQKQSVAKIAKTLYTFINGKAGHLKKGQKKKEARFSLSGKNSSGPQSLKKKKRQKKKKTSCLNGLSKSF